MTMWETLLGIHYSDFTLVEDDIVLDKSLSTQLKTKLLHYNESVLNTRYCCEIPETTGQSDSTRWHTERKCRVTTSL